MNIYTKLAKLLDVAEITDNFTRNVSLEIGEWQTADGYEVHVMTEDPQNIQFDYDVFYYTPTFDQVIDRIRDFDSDDIVYVSDFDTYLDASEVERYIEEKEQELLENLEVENYDL